MDAEDAARIVRETVIDDYYGLWEILWACNTAFPDEGLSKKRELAEAAVRRLVAEGTVDVYRGRTFHGDERLVEHGEFDSALADVWWQPHGEEEHTRVYASASYRKSYGKPLL